MAFKYHGILAKPQAYDPPLGLLADDEARAAWSERYKAGMWKRLSALFEAHGVDMYSGSDSEALWQLLLRMAEAHVPGFQMKRKSGPREVWGCIEKAELRIAVDDYIASRKQEGKRASITHACGVLAKQDPWRAKIRKTAGRPADALRGHYNTADPRWVNVVRDARAWDALPEHEKTPYQKVLGRGLFGFTRNLPQETSRRKKSD